MKRYLYISIFLSLLFSCSNNLLQEKRNNESLQLEGQEKAFLGYDEEKVYDSSIIIKVASFNNAELDQFVSLLKNLNVVEKSRNKAFVDGEMYLTLKAFGNYPETLRKIRNMDGVIYAEPNYRMKVIDSYGEKKKFLKPFNLSDGNLEKDPEGNLYEYALEITKALRSYKDFGYGKHTVWAGIIDTGTNGNHEDLVYEDGKKVVKILKSAFGGPYENQIVEVTTGNSDTDAENAGHGTHCTGSICAVGNNNKGIAGAAWKNVNFISYKGLKDGGGSLESIYGSLRDLVDTVRKQVTQEEQATIPVNLSLGGLTASNYAMEQLNYALSKGILPVIANGNDGQLVASYPAACPGVLSVGASGDNDKKATFSTYGPWINIVAPGLNIISLGHLGENNYVTMSGTSMATPFVSGVITYLLSFEPTLTPSQIIAILESTADKIDASNKNPQARYNENGFSTWYGHGRVNVYEAAKMIHEKRVPPKGKDYLETTLRVNVSYPNSAIHVYEKNTGVLVTMSLSYGKSPAHADIRGLRPGTYNVVFNQKMQEVTIGNDKDITIQF